MGKLDGKVAIVTGASQGIGLAIARGLAKEGAAIVLVARNAEKLNSAAEGLSAYGATTIAFPCDLTEEGEIEQLFAAVSSRFGRLDLLVNNAGAFDGGPLDELSTEDWDHVLAVNLRAPFLCTRG